MTSIVERRLRLQFGDLRSFLDLTTSSFVHELARLQKIFLKVGTIFRDRTSDLTTSHHVRVVHGNEHHYRSIPNRVESVQRTYKIVELRTSAVRACGMARHTTREKTRSLGGWLPLPASSILEDILPPFPILYRIVSQVTSTISFKQLCLVWGLVNKTTLV